MDLENSDNYDYNDLGSILTLPFDNTLNDFVKFDYPVDDSISPQIDQEEADSFDASFFRNNFLEEQEEEIIRLSETNTLPAPENLEKKSEKKIEPKKKKVKKRGKKVTKYVSFEEAGARYETRVAKSTGRTYKRLVTETIDDKGEKIKLIYKLYRERKGKTVTTEYRVERGGFLYSAFVKKNNEGFEVVGFKKSVIKSDKKTSKENERKFESLIDSESVQIRRKKRQRIPVSNVIENNEKNLLKEMKEVKVDVTCVDPDSVIVRRHMIILIGVSMSNNGSSSFVKLVSLNPEYIFRLIVSYPHNPAVVKLAFDEDSTNKVEYFPSHLNHLY